MPVIMDGKALAAQLMASLQDRVAALKARGVQPGLAVVLVGEDPASQIYVRNKERACQELSLHSETIRLSADTTQAALEAQIDRLNADHRIHGILVQLPLPAGLDEEAALARILPEKDVDGFHAVNAGKLMTGADGVIPCTPKGILYMLKASGVPLAGKEAVVIGRSNIVGKPVAMLLLREDAAVTVCHSRTPDTAALTRQADIIITAAGVRSSLTAAHVRPGQTVVDVSVNGDGSALCGDADFAAVEPVVDAITPVPGGVGTVTSSVLMAHTVRAAELLTGEGRL